MPLLLFSSQDGATSARGQTHVAPRAPVRHCETETRSSTRANQPLSGAPWDQWCMWLWTGLRSSCTPRRPWHGSCNPRRSRRWPSSGERSAVCLRSLRPSGPTLGRFLDVEGDSDWAGDEEEKCSTTGVAEIFGGPPHDISNSTLSSHEF